MKLVFKTSDAFPPITEWSLWALNNSSKAMELRLSLKTAPLSHAIVHKVPVEGEHSLLYQEEASSANRGWMSLLALLAELNTAWLARPYPEHRSVDRIGEDTSGSLWSGYNYPEGVMPTR